MPFAAWKAIALRAWREAAEDNISLIASGVAFCGVLAMVPMLGAIVLSYGLMASPRTVVENMQSLTSVMPTEAAKLVGDQLANVVHTAGGKKGFGLLIALGIALYGAMKGAGALVTALNIAYDETEARSFVRLNLLSLAVTLSALLLAILAIISIAAMGHLQALFPHMPSVLLVLGKIFSYLVMASLGAAAAATVYRFGPDRDEPKWTWLTPGSVFTALLWLVVTLGFGFYVAHFGSYDATYGTLGGAIVLLTWLYLSAYILLLGAELNSEVERQTACDTTVGAEQPLGSSGAYAADTVATTPDTDNDGATASESSAPQTPVRDYLAARATSRLQHLGGLEKVGILPAILTTGGLAFLRRKGRAGLGIALLATGAGLSWLSRGE
jgi:membrane protein